MTKKLPLKGYPIGKLLTVTAEQIQIDQHDADQKEYDADIAAKDKIIADLKAQLACSDPKPLMEVAGELEIENDTLKAQLATSQQGVERLKNLLKELCDFLYAYSGVETKVNSQDYQRFKEKYLKGYDLLAALASKGEE